MKRRFGWQRGRHDITEDVRREIDFHVAEHVRELMARGMSEPAARAQARTAFGDRGTIESELHTLRDETLRTRQRRDLIGNVLLDARIALRGLRRNSGFAVAACLTIALAIGANTAVFSVVRSVLLRPLPYPAANQLVQLWTDYRARAGRTTPEWLTPPGFADWRDQNRTFTAMAAYQGWGPVLTGAGEPASLNGLAVSGDYFRVLAIPPLRGRALTPADDEPGAAPVAVLSYSLWSSRFGSDPSVIDRSITLDGVSWRVVGVMPATFRAPVAAQPAIYRTIRRPANGGCGRGCIVLRAVGRLKPGMTFAQAQADISGIARREAELYPASNRGVGAWLIPLHEQITGPTRQPLLALSAAVGLVLLIACVNVANLLLLRGAAREREFGVRAALGAGRGRLIGQLMTENGILAMTGGALGLALGVAGARALEAVVPTGIRGIQSVGIDGYAVAFSIGATVVSAILFGLLPSLQAARRDLMELLRTSVGNVGHQRSGARQHLVSVQLVLAMVLVVGAGLLLRSLVAMEQVDLGYRQGGVLLEGVTLPPTRYAPDRIGPAMTDLIARLRGRTGIRTVEVTDLPPLSPGDQDMT
ncbi:MAG: ABC transporter permease, partial [Gemmatimonadales bacterium]